MGKKIRTNIERKKSKFSFKGVIDDFPEEAITKCPRIITNGEKCTIEGNCQIIEYEDTLFKISSKSGQISFLGENLSLVGFNDFQIVFEGKINTIEFVFR